MAKRVNKIWELAKRYNIVFAEFPDHRYHVYCAAWFKPKIVFLGCVIKESGIWRFWDGKSVKSYFGLSRTDAVTAYLLENPLSGKEV